MDLDQLSAIRVMLPGIWFASEGKARRDHVAKLRQTHPGMPEPTWISLASYIQNIFRDVLKGGVEKSGCPATDAAVPLALAYLSLGDIAQWDAKVHHVIGEIEGHMNEPASLKPDRAFEFALAWLLGWRREVIWEQSSWLGCPSGAWSAFALLVHDLIKEVRQWTAEGDLQSGAAPPGGQPLAHGRNARVPSLLARWAESHIPAQAEAICRQLTRQSVCSCAALGWAQIASGGVTPEAASVLAQILDAEADGTNPKAAVEAAIRQFLAGERLNELRIAQKNKATPEQTADNPLIEAYEAEIEAPGSLATAATGDSRFAKELEKLGKDVGKLLAQIDALQQTAPPGSMVLLNRNDAVTLAVRADNVAKEMRSCLLHHCLGSWDGALSLWKFLRQALLGNFATTIKASGLTSGMLFPILESETKLGHVDVLVRICANCTDNPARTQNSVVPAYARICPHCQMELSAQPETLNPMLIVADPDGAGGFLPVKVWKCKTCPPVYGRGKTKFPAYWELADGRRQCPVSPDHKLSSRLTNAWRYTGDVPGDPEVDLKATVERMVEMLGESGRIEEWTVVAALDVIEVAAARAARECRSLRAVLDFAQPLTDPASVLEKMRENNDGKSHVPINDDELRTAWALQGNTLQQLWARVRDYRDSTSI